MDQLPIHLLNAKTYLPVSTNRKCSTGRNAASGSFVAKMCTEKDTKLLSEGYARYNSGNRALAIARDFASYGDKKSVERCIAEKLDNDDDGCSTSLETTFDYYDSSVGTDKLPTGNIPVFVMTRNTTLSYRPWNLFDTSGEGEENGFCHAALALSHDVHAEVYTFDGVKDEGTVTLYKRMQPYNPPINDDEPTDDEFVFDNHSHLTLRFYKRGKEIRWHNAKGNDTQSTIGMQLSLLIFTQNTMHYATNTCGFRDVNRTLQHVEDVILKQLIDGSRKSSHEAYTLIYMTGDSWKYNPPMEYDHEGSDIRCFMAPEDPHKLIDKKRVLTSSLKEELVKEYPCGVDVNRKFHVSEIIMN